MWNKISTYLTAHRILKCVLISSILVLAACSGSKNSGGGGKGAATSPPASTAKFGPHYTAAPLPPPATIKPTVPSKAKMTTSAAKAMVRRVVSALGAGPRVAAPGTSSGPSVGPSSSPSPSPSTLPVAISAPSLAPSGSRFPRKRIGEGPYAPRASGTLPEATEKHFKLLSTAEVSSLVLSTSRPQGDFGLEPVDLQVRAGKEIDGLLPAAPKSVLTGVLLEDGIDQMERLGSLAIPLLVVSNGDSSWPKKEIYRAQEVCLADNLLECRRDFTSLLSDPVTDIAHRRGISLVPRLSFDPMMKPDPDESLVIRFAKISLGPKISLANYLTSLPGYHPGENDDLKALIDQAVTTFRRLDRRGLDNQRHFFYQTPRRLNMRSFIEAFKLADCDMNALGVVQKVLEDYDPSPLTPFVMNGNRPTSNVFDFETKNHAWNGFVDELDMGTLISHDVTPEPHPDLEPFFNGDTLMAARESLRRIENANDDLASVIDLDGKQAMAEAARFTFENLGERLSEVPRRPEENFPERDQLLQAVKAEFPPEYESVEIKGTVCEKRNGYGETVCLLDKAKEIVYRVFVNPTTHFGLSGEFVFATDGIWRGLNYSGNDLSDRSRYQTVVANFHQESSISEFTFPIHLPRDEAVLAARRVLERFPHLNPERILQEVDGADCVPDSKTGLYQCGKVAGPIGHPSVEEVVNFWRGEGYSVYPMAEARMDTITFQTPIYK
jgi:hypothetical protein